MLSNNKNDGFEGRGDNFDKKLSFAKCYHAIRLTNEFPAK